MKIGGGSTPFWTYTKYKDNEVATIKNNAYKLFEATILREIGYKYSKYGFQIMYRDFATDRDESIRCHPNQGIWWDGVDFNSLYYYDSNKTIHNLNSYSIYDTICNRDNIWNGKILEPIQRIINEYEKESIKK